MGRKDKFTVDYFPHNCTNGKTIFILESRFGNNGYAVWFKTLELLGSSNNHFIDCRNTTDWEFMSAKMQIEPDRLQQIYNLLANLKAIDQDLWEHKIIWSQKFIDNLEDVYSRRTNICMNKSDICKHLLIKCGQKSINKKINVSRNSQTKLNYTKQKKTIVLSRTKFKIPTKEEITEYANEQKIPITIAADCYYYYDKIGWTVGKDQKPMVSWKSALSGWWNREKRKANINEDYYIPRYSRGDYIGDNMKSIGDILKGKES